MIRAGPVLLCGALGYRDSINQIKGDTIMATKHTRRLTAANEVFARKISLENMNQTDAYACAYDVSGRTPEAVHKASSALALKPEVAGRIQLLKGRAEAKSVKAAAYTLDSAMGEAEQLLQDAQALGQISAGVAAAKLRAQLSGHLTEKTPDKGNVLDSMDADGLLEMRKEVEARIQRAKEALDLVGEAPLAPAAHRRVIN